MSRQVVHAENEPHHGGDAQVGDIVELLDESAEVAEPVAIGVAERFEVELVDDGVVVPSGMSSVLVMKRGTVVSAAIGLLSCAVNAQCWPGLFPIFGFQRARIRRRHSGATSRPKSDVSRWLYNQGNATSDRPGDLGYFIGYRIAESYYQKMANKRAAVRDIIQIRDANDFLTRGGYAP